MNRLFYIAFAFAFFISFANAGVIINIRKPTLKNITDSSGNISTIQIPYAIPLRFPPVPTILFSYHSIVWHYFGPQQFDPMTFVANPTQQQIFFVPINGGPGCPNSNTYPPGSLTGMLAVGIATSTSCFPEYFLPAVARAGAVAALYCDPVFAASSAGFQYYAKNLYSFNDPGIPFLVASDCVAGIAAMGNGFLPLTKTFAGGTNVSISLSIDDDDWRTSGFWSSSAFFVFSRIFFPFWGFALSISAFYKLVGFIRQQGGLRVSSLAQWSMAFEIIANVFRSVSFLGFRYYITTTSNFAMSMSEGFIMCNMVLAAIFWGTLDVNSSPLYRLRYVAIFLCVAFLAITAAFCAMSTGNIVLWSPILTDWQAATEAAIGCLIMLFVLRRLWQLSRFKIDAQEEATAGAAGGEAAVKANEEYGEENDGAQQQSVEAKATQVKPTAARPIVKKMLYWTCLISINCICAILNLIIQETFEGWNTTQRISPYGFTFSTIPRGILLLTMSSCQLMLYVPKKRRGTGSTVGSKSVESNMSKTGTTV